MALLLLVTILRMILFAIESSYKDDNLKRPIIDEVSPVPTQSYDLKIQVFQRTVACNYFFKDLRQ